MARLVRVASIPLTAAAFASVIPVRALMVGNSDTLLAAAYAEKLLHHPTTIAAFELSRLPSFVPDLALYLALSSILPWRTAAYAIASYVALVLVAGGIGSPLSPLLVPRRHHLPCCLGARPHDRDGLRRVTTHQLK